MYEKRVVEARKKITIAQAELERIKENIKITKKGKRNRAVLEKECKGLSATKLVSFMEKHKAILRKLKRGFSRSRKNEEARILNQQFQADTSKVYANMRELLDKDKENERPRYTTSDQNTQEDKEMFNNVDEASEYWRNLSESEGTGDRCASWLEEIRSPIQRRVPSPTECMWTQHWPVTYLKIVDGEARKIIVEKGGKHPGGSTALLYLPREKRRRGLPAVETEYKVTKVKAALRFYKTRIKLWRW